MDTDKTLHPRYAGESTPLFWLALKTSLMTLITLGIYRFWAKTRIRKYFWSSVVGEGDGFEYTGTGIEKLVGFLVAVFVLAIYLGIFQAILYFAGLSLLQETDFSVVFLLTLPLIFFAQYRARRYRLARTRWRGVRFGAESAAWGYMFRACWHLFLVVITLGILLPRQTFFLEKFVTDRSWYGNAKFEQTGKWTALFPAAIHVFIGGAIILCGSVLLGIGGASMLEVGPENFIPPLAVYAVLVLIVGCGWLMIGATVYRIRSFAYLASNKVLDGHIRFTAQPETGTLIMKAIFGNLMVGFAIGIPALLAIGLISAIFAPIVEGTGEGSLVLTLLFVVMILGIFAFAGALRLIWVAQPIVAHLVQSVVIRNAEGLDAIRQRAADAGADAEGFADALDVGGGI